MRTPRIQLPALAALLAVSLLCAGDARAQLKKPRWGAEATRFMKGKVQVKNRRLFINVRSFGKHYKEQTQWGEAAKGTVEFRFDPSLNVGHTTIRVGKTEYQMLGSKAAKANKFEHSQILSESSGAVYRVSKRDLQKMDGAFQKVVESANKYNFPAFSISGRTLTVAQRQGGWEILKTKRRAETRTITAKLVTNSGQEFLESPNGYRQRVLSKTTGPDGKMQLKLNSRSCTSFVTNTLSSLRLETLPRIQNTVSARGLANTLMSGSGSRSRGDGPDGVVHYSVDAQMPTDLPGAVSKVLTTKSE
jgi:hypothetical protein